MKKVFIVIIIILVIGIAGFIIINSFGPDLKQFERLKEPTISTLNDQKMIEVALRGNPSETAGKGIGLLFKTFFMLKGNNIKMAAPRARWPLSLDSKKDTWLGIFGLPVSENVTKLPEQKDGLVKLSIWKYGTVAEILHIGPYSAETPTIEKLIKYIKDNGYKIIGDHEEEYLKGPGFLINDPKNYYTIIRYRVKKKPSSR